MNRSLLPLLLAAALALPAAADPLETAASHARLYRQMSAPPPLEPGYWVPALPEESAALRVDGVVYYVLDGVFYRPAERGFVVVKSPEGALLERLPLGHAIVEVEGVRYYVVGDHFFVRDEARGGYRFTAAPSARVESATVERVVYHARPAPTAAAPAPIPTPEVESSRAGKTG